MLVKELREELAKMPGEMNVYCVNGYGIASAKHIFRANLIDVEQFCELRTHFEDHTPQFEDTLIERETGFKNRRELLDAFKALRDSDEHPKDENAKRLIPEGMPARAGTASPNSNPETPTNG